MNQKREFRPQPNQDRPDYPEGSPPEPEGDDAGQSTPKVPVVRMPGAPMVPDWKPEKASSRLGPLSRHK